MTQIENRLSASARTGLHVAVRRKMDEEHALALALAEALVW